MADYIERQAAIELCDWYQHEFCECDYAFGELANELHKLPSADVQPVRHGHWIIKDNPGTGWYRVTCSECGEDVTSVAPVIGFFPKAKVIWDFCPECGTRMDGEQNATD